MVKVLQATERGQITLPKKWREKFGTQYFKAVITDKVILIKPLLEEKNFDKDIIKALKEYEEGKTVSHEELKKKYGISN